MFYTFVDSTIPEDWDIEEDGEWMPPSIPNPKCEDAPGCGEWKAPLIPNPEFKGEWTAPFIENPDYKVCTITHLRDWQS